MPCRDSNSDQRPFVVPYFERVNIAFMAVMVELSKEKGFKDLISRAQKNCEHSILGLIDEHKEREMIRIKKKIASEFSSHEIELIKEMALAPDPRDLVTFDIPEYLFKGEGVK